LIGDPLGPVDRLIAAFSVWVPDISIIVRHEL
jgi:hypothetical protein